MSGIAVVLVLCVAFLGLNSAHDDPLCSEAPASTATGAKNVLAVLGGRSRVMTVLMNLVKCLQKASNDMYKLTNDILAELAGCMAKSDPFEMVKCVMSDSGMKKISAIVMRTMEVVKCSLD